MQRKTILIIGGIAVALIVGGCGAAAAGSGGSSATPAASTEVTKTVQLPPVYITKTVEPPTVTAPAPPPVTVTEPAPPPVTVTVEPAPAEPPAEAPAPTAGGDLSSPKDNGTYIVGSEIAAGNWKCSAEEPGGLMWWETADENGEPIDLGTAGLAGRPPRVVEGQRSYVRYERYHANPA